MKRLWLALPILVVLDVSPERVNLATRGKEKGDRFSCQDLRKYPLLFDPSPADSALRECEVGQSEAPCQNHLHKSHRQYQDQKPSLLAYMPWIRGTPKSDRFCIMAG